tara:strand:- start:843 stop:1502 length:660 start_codon:yes stop_codon:yes gene_type:complete
MWTLYTLTSIGFFGYFLNKIYRKFYPSVLKSFEDVYEDDEYTLLCYHIRYEDNTVEDVLELTDEEIEDLDTKNKIKYITMDYMFNGKFMKYITYEKDITFPFYVFNVEPPKYPYYPEMVILNNVDVTSYVTPYLGPLCNFYNDRHAPIKLEDAMVDHPKFKEFDFNNGTLMMISNDTPLEGKKIIARELPCNLIWKRHAAVDPRDDHKLKDFELINKES